MRYIGVLLTLTIILSTSKLHAQDLDTYKWKNRIILLKDTSLDSDWLQAQLKRLHSNSQELIEREVLLFLVANNSIYNEKRIKTVLRADSIVSKYDLLDFKGLVLIGKDGSTKLKKEFIVNPSTIIELIDKMPFRMTEMKNNPN